MNQSETYRLRKVSKNRVAFAAVTIVITPRPKGEEISVFHADGDEVPLAWMEAAVEGVRVVANFISIQASRPLHLAIHVASVLGNASDTSEDVVQCAAGMVTWKALAPTSWPQPEVVEVGKRWVLRQRLLPALSA